MTHENQFDSLEEVLEALQDIPQPNPERRAAYRADLLARVDELHVQRAEQLLNIEPPVNLLAQFFNGSYADLSPMRRVRNMLAIVIAVVVVVFGGLGGVAYASNGAGPGDALYSIDRTVENVQYGLASQQGRSALSLRLAQERFDEAQDLMSDDSSEDQLLGIDEAIAAIEALLDNVLLSSEAREIIEGQLAMLQAMRAELDPNTLIELEIEQEDGTTTVDIEVEDSPDDSPDDSSPATDAGEIVGTLDSISGQTYVIDGTSYPLAPNAEVKGTLVAGDRVKVHLVTLADGTLAIREIERAEADDANDDDGDENSSDDSSAGAVSEAEFVGTLNSVAGTTYVIDGVSYTLAANGEVKGTLVAGSLVKVHLVTLADGSQVIREIELTGTTGAGSSDDSNDDNSGSDDSGDDAGDDHSDDNSGSSSDDDDHDDDNSGSSHDDDDDHDDDNSGSGSHDDDDDHDDD